MSSRSKSWTGGVKPAVWLVFLEPALRDRVAVRGWDLLRVGVQFPQASVVERGDRVEDAVPLPVAAVVVEQGFDLALRLGPGDEARLARRAREKPTGA